MRNENLKKQIGLRAYKTFQQRTINCGNMNEHLAV